MLANGLLQVFSVVFLTFIMSLTFGMIEFDEPREVAVCCVKWWGKFVGGLFLIGLVVHVLSSIG